MLILFFPLLDFCFTWVPENLTNNIFALILVMYLYLRNNESSLKKTQGCSCCYRTSCGSFYHATVLCWEDGWADVKDRREPHSLLAVVWKLNCLEQTEELLLEHGQWFLSPVSEGLSPATRESHPGVAALLCLSPALHPPINSHLLYRRLEAADE